MALKPYESARNPPIRLPMKLPVALAAITHPLAAPAGNFA